MRNIVNVVLLNLLIFCSRYRSITEQYYRKADGVLTMYDVTHSASFTAVRGWIDSVKVSWLSCKTVI